MAIRRYKLGELLTMCMCMIVSNCTLEGLCQCLLVLCTLHLLFKAVVIIALHLFRLCPRSYSLPSYFYNVLEKTTTFMMTKYIHVYDLF